MKKIVFSSLCVFLLCGCDEIAQKGSQTLQDALEDSGLKDTLIEKSEQLNEFNNQARDFLQSQGEILQEEVGKALESNATKEMLQQQMENLNEILGGKPKESQNQEESTSPDSRQDSTQDSIQESFDL